MKKLRQYLTLILTLAAFGSPVIAQPATSPDLQGDITIVDGQDLETSLENALTNAVTEATDQLNSGTTVGGLFSSPAFLTTVFALVNAILVFLTTNAVKLQTMLKGNKTLLLASLLSAVTSGLGVYFGPGAALGVPERIALAAAAALGTLGGAVGIHETRRAAQTGQRKPERKAGAVVADTVLESLVIAGKLLPPPFNLAEPVIRNLYKAHGAAFVKDLIDQQRAMSEAELNAAGDAYEKAHPVKKTTVTPAPEVP